MTPDSANAACRVMTTGLPGLDRVLQGLRPGDNVVWQVTSVSDCQPFFDAFCRSAAAHGARVIYFRFAQHPELIPRDVPVAIHRLNPEEGFERFISRILDVIEQAGEGAHYVFDCLSDLAVDWHSDRMLGNFFMLACPFLYRLNTIAYFALLRNHHSFHASDPIEQTAQVILNVYSSQARLYVHPVKVDQRYTPTMFMPHFRDGDDFRPVTDSSTTTDIFSQVPQPWTDFSIHRLGIWTQTVSRAQRTVEAARAGRATMLETQDAFHRILRMAITRDDRFIRLARRYFSLGDLIEILQRMIGTGLIGGKSLGMFMARAILRKSGARLASRFEAHDSFFIGSDVFYTFLVQNGCWWLRRQQTAPGSAFDRLDEVQQKIMSGHFPPYIEHQFGEMLEYFGQSPIIVRSSSLLEDSYGNAFSGKYASVYCANQGAPADRLRAFTTAVRTVYASTLSREAVNYRADCGLLDRDEQMAILVQRVSGGLHGRLFFPHMAGVGFSFNPYVWSEDVNPADGMLRLVAGLGTRAVNRTEDDYTRLVALSAPHRSPHMDEDARRKFTQRRIDVLDLDDNQLVTRDIETGLAAIEPEHLLWLTDGKADQPLTYGRLFSDSPFVEDMREALHALEEAYHSPVDIEFTVNFTPDGSYRVNLLQCRPFQARVRGGTGPIGPPADAAGPHVILASSGPIIGRSVSLPVAWIVHVAPGAYAPMPHSRRYALARLIGRIMRHPRVKASAGVILAGPGRWGTTTPSMGIPVSFSEIRSADVLVEIAMVTEGLIPDISLGTHFFNDLVEKDILYVGIFPDKPGHRLNDLFLRSEPNQLVELLPDAECWSDAVQVVEGARNGRRVLFHADAVAQRAVCCLRP